MSAKILGQNDTNLIASLPKIQRSNFLKLCDRVDLSAGDDLCQTNQNIEYVYFPETSILGLVSLIRDHVPSGSRCDLLLKMKTLSVEFIGSRFLIVSQMEEYHEKYR